MTDIFASSGTLAKRYSGFTTTVVDSASVTDLSSLTWDGDNTTFVIKNASRTLVLLSGGFTATIKTSISTTAPPYSEAASCNKEKDTFTRKDIAGKLFRLSGQFTNTIKDSLSVTGSDIGIDANKHSVVAHDTIGVGASPYDQLRVHSGQFSATIKTSLSDTGFDIRGVSYLSGNTPVANVYITPGPQLELLSGQFSTTVKDSVAISAQSIDPDDFNRRVGFYPTADSTVTFTQSVFRYVDHSPNNSITFGQDLTYDLDHYVDSTVTLDGAVVGVVDRQASNSITFTSDVVEVKYRVLTDNTITLDHTAVATRYRVLTDSTITLDHTAVADSIISRSISQTITLTSTEVHLRLRQPAVSTVTFTQTVEYVITKASSEIVLTQEAVPHGSLRKTIEPEVVVAQFVRHNILALNTSSEVSFSDATNREPTTFNRSVTHNFYINQSARLAVDASASSSITFTDELNKAGAETSTIAFTQDTTAELSSPSTSTITITQSVVVSKTANLTATSGITFGSSAVGFLPASGCSLRNYAPVNSSDARGYTQPAATATLGTNTNITFSYSGTDLILRSPDLGNSIEVTTNRILNITRNRTAKTKTRSTKFKVLTVTCSKLSQAKATEALAFLLTSLGQEVTLLDHENRNWSGVITNPDSAVVQTGRGCQFELQLIFEGREV